jgi:fibronectin-binding autotransporter adhesin
MTSYTWIGGSGSWSTAADWGGGPPNGPPTEADSATIAVAGITVSIAGGVAADCYTLTTIGSELKLDGGTLFTVAGANYGGAFVESSGTYTVGGTGAIFQDGLTMTGGTMDVLSGALSIEADSTLQGTLSGSGALQIVSGTTILDAGFSTTLNSIVIGGAGALGLGINFTYGGDFVEQTGGICDLFGHTLTLTGQAQLDGTVGNGLLVETASSTITLGPAGTNFYFNNGLIAHVGGTIDQTCWVYAGDADAGAAIDILKTGQYDISGNWNIYNPSSIGTIVNAGIFAKIAGGKVSTVYTNFTSKGTVETNIGELTFAGLVNSISGTVSGSGTLGLAGGQTTFGKKLDLKMTELNQQSGVLVLDAAMSYGGEWDQSGGQLNLDKPAAVLTLSGQVDLNGGTLTGFGGSLALSSTTETANISNYTIGGPNTLTVDGTVDQTGVLSLGAGSNPVVDISSTGTWSIEADTSIVGSFGLIDNFGTFGTPNGSADAFVQSVIDNTGTITANNSTLTLGGAVTLGGTTAGNGLLILGSTTVMEAGLKLDVASLSIGGTTALNANQSYVGNFFETSGANLALFGNTLSLSGTVSLDGGILDVFGTLSTSGPTAIGNYLLIDGSDLLVTGNAEQTGALTMFEQNDGAGMLTVAGTYTLDDDLNISGGGAISVAGTFIAAGTGASRIDATMTDTGLLEVNDQTLTLGGGGAFSGSVQGAGQLLFADTTGLADAVFVLEKGESLTMASWSIGSQATAQLDTGVSYAGIFSEAAGGAIGLNSNTLTLTGTAGLFGGSVSGPGTLLASGTIALANVALVGGAVLDITGSAEQTATITVGETGNLAELTVAKGATYLLDESASIVGVGTLAVAGTLTDATDGVSQIGVSIVDTGVIAANLGTLQVLGAVGGSGVFTIGAAGRLEFGAGSTITASNTISLTAGGADLRLDTPGTFGAMIANFSTSDIIELGGFSGTSLTGSYANGAHTELLVTDGAHSVTLTFTTAQNLASITFTTASDGLAALIHH